MQKLFYFYIIDGYLCSKQNTKVGSFCLLPREEFKFNTYMYGGWYQKVTKNIEFSKYNSRTKDTFSMSGSFGKIHITNLRKKRRPLFKLRYNSNLSKAMYK